MQNSNSTPLAQRFTIFSLLRFAAPSIGMMLVISLYTVTDGIFIGRYAGASALAASNIVYPAINLIFGLAIMLASGGSALVAKNLGEGQKEAATRRFSFLTAAGAGIGLALALAIGLFLAPILHFLGASDTLLAECRSYLGTMLPFFPMAALMVIFNAFYIADGRPIQGFIVSVLSGVTNAALDYVFLAHMELGIYGAALATGLADLLAAVIGLVYFTHFSRTLRLTAFQAESAVLHAACSNGISELVTQLSVGIVTFLFNIITFHWAGEAGVAAISVILYAEMLLTSILMGFTNGVAPIFSYNFGARRHAELTRLLKLSLGVIMSFSLLSFIMARLLAQPLIRLFLPDGGSTFALTLTGFLLFSLSFLLVGFNIFASGFFTALSDGKTSALLSFARNLAGIVIFLLMLPRFLGLEGVWLAVPAADAAALLLTLSCLKSENQTLQRQKKAFPKREDFSY
ncbi:Na+-driven multidrug efflux pump [Selenomonas sp. GACV-9]|uniref:MATE family efflux transporter n=1 Tax=Selenomonas sp. GACV-9 TaxID=3158782 RepID=UPI0008EC81DC|nr:Na+-driven multidrug efflux pump [Selenomonas ruminantium]